MQVLQFFSLQLLDRVDQVVLHCSHSAHEIVSALLQLLDVAIAVTLLLLNQVVQPALIGLQVQVLLHLFPQIFDLRGRATGKVVELSDGQVPIILVQVEFLENIPPSLEVAIDSIAVMIDFKAEVEQFLDFLVLQGGTGADVCPIEPLLELKPGTRVNLHFLCVGKQIYEPFEVFEKASLVAGLYLEVLIGEELLQDLVLVDGLGVDQTVQHFLQFMLPIVEKLLIYTTEIRQVGFQALLWRKFRQDEAFISAAEVIHQPLKLRVPSVDLPALEDYMVFEDGFEEVLSELVVACYLH